MDDEICCFLFVLTQIQAGAEFPTTFAGEVHLDNVSPDKDLSFMSVVWRIVLLMQEMFP